MCEKRWRVYRELYLSQCVLIWILRGWGRAAEPRAFVCEHLCASISVRAFLCEHLCASICVRAFVCEHLCATDPFPVFPPKRPVCPQKSPSCLSVSMSAVAMYTRPLKLQSGLSCSVSWTNSLSVSRTTWLLCTQDLSNYRVVSLVESRRSWLVRGSEWLVECVWDEEDGLHNRGIDFCKRDVCFWWLAIK